MKTKMIFIAIMALLTVTLFTSCEKIKGKGEVITETRSSGTFTKIGLDMSATIYFTQDATYSLRVSGQENVLREVVTQVEGNQLVVKLKKGVILGSHDPVTVYISAPDLVGLDVSGSGDIYSDSPWNLDELSTTISGSGSINIAMLTARHISSSISGSGSITVSSGTITNEDLNISGSGTIDLRGIGAESAYTRTSGSGTTYVKVTSQLDATISGSGNVWYYGTPAINTHISGSGSVKHL
ncbi:MAG: head GIN domain-containing protein [Bacteroidales bacterium]